MRVLATAAAVFATVIAAVLFLWPQPRAGFEPILYGRDTCARCRMHISRPGFAGELRDSGGILTKYDDIGCMMLDLPRAGDLPEAWVEDYAGGGFVPLDDATLVRTETLETPMGYGVFAFENIADAHAFAAGNAGSTVRVDDLLRDVRQSGSVAGRSKDG